MFGGWIFGIVFFLVLAYEVFGQKNGKNSK